MISHIADENEGRRRQDYDNDNDRDHTDNNPYPRAIYQNCLRQLVGVQTPQDVDTLLANEDDLVMLGLFDPAMIYRRNALIVKPEHMSLITRRGFNEDGGGVGVASEDWMEEDHPRQHEGAGVGAEVWELRGALLGILGYG